MRQSLKSCKKKLQAGKLAEIFHVIVVNQAGLGLASKIAHATQLVTDERKEQDKAALCCFLEGFWMWEGYMQVLILVADESKSWQSMFYSYHWAVSYKFQCLVFKSLWNLLEENFSWSRTQHFIFWGFDYSEPDRLMEISLPLGNICSKAL